MTRFGLAMIVAVMAGTPANAGGNPGSGGLPPARPLVTSLSQLAPPEPPPDRYAMTYSESVARSLHSLGVEDGQLNLSAPQPRNPYVPSLSLDGSMLRLHWHP